MKAHDIPLLRDHDVVLVSQLDRLAAHSLVTDVHQRYPELKAAFDDTEYLISAVVWCTFTVVWLAVVLAYPRPSSLRFDLLVPSFAVLKAAAGFTRCHLLQLPDDLASSVKHLGEGEFALLILILARGWGLTRTELTAAEVVAIAVYGAVLVATPALVPLWLVDCVLCVLVVVYAAKTYTMLDVVYPGISLQRNQLIYRKRRIFMYVIILSVTSLFLPATLTIGALILFGSQVVDMLKYLFEAVDYFAPIVLAVAFLLLQLHRDEPEFGEPLVDTDDVYRVREEDRLQGSYLPPSIYRSQVYGANYPPQGQSYVQPAYPPLLQGYPQQAQGYPPHPLGYSQQVQGYPPPVQGYPPPPFTGSYSQPGV